MNLKRLISFLAVTAVICTVVATEQTFAEEPSSITDFQLTQIRVRCKEVQASLSRVHANDALLRVNRGQLYERLSTKLMVPLNSRIAVNRLDGSSLLSVTSNYDRHLGEFRINYKAYEEQLSTTMRIDCTKQPASFYESLKSSRDKRRSVYESAQQLAKDIGEYRQAFTDFSKPYREKQS